MPKLNLSSGTAWLRRAALAAFTATALSACGGGAEIVIGGGSDVDALDLALTRVGPLAIAVDWSDHPWVDRFSVFRDGFLLASVDATSLIDASVLLGETYCYEVEGYDVQGFLIAASPRGCITVLP